MNIRKLISSRSFKDFSSLFFSNIFQKLFGFVREPIIAFFFGSSLLYANYLLLRTAADLFSQFTVGNALKANLLPKFTKIYDTYKKVSLKRVFSFSNRTMFFLFVFSQIIQSAIIIYLDSEYNYILFIISILLSFSICFNFLNNLFLTIMQSKGQFFKFSIATTLNSFIVAVFIYPFTLFCGIFGLVISRLLGIVILTFSYILPMNRERDGYELKLTRKDLNISTLILGNFANIIIICSRFLSGSDGSNNITYFTYSIFILNALLTSVIGSLSTLLLRKVSIKKNTKFMYLSLGISVFVGSLLILFLHYFNKLSLIKANATKMVIVLIYTSGAIITFALADKIDWTYGLFLASGNFLGGWVCSRWMIKKSEKIIKLFLVVMVILMSMKLWFFNN